MKSISRISICVICLCISVSCGQNEGITIVSRTHSISGLATGTYGDKSYDITDTVPVSHEVEALWIGYDTCYNHSDASAGNFRVIAHSRACTFGTYADAHADSEYIFVPLYSQLTLVIEAGVNMHAFENQAGFELYDIASGQSIDSQTWTTETDLSVKEQRMYVLIPGFQYRLRLNATAEKDGEPGGSYSELSVELNSQPRTLYVDDNAVHDPGPNNPSISDPAEDGSPEHPFDMVQEAIDAAHDDDTVQIIEGQYVENLTIAQKAITVQSTDPNDSIITGNTLLDGGAAGSVICVEDVNQPGKSVALLGLNITNGLAEKGGGINCQNSHLVVFNCLVVSDKTLSYSYKASNADSAGGGGGIYLQASTATVTGCYIGQNMTGSGGDADWMSGSGGNGAGICCMDSDTVVSDTDILSNTTGAGGRAQDGQAGQGGAGGGIYCDSLSSLVVEGGLFVLNKTGQGGSSLNDTGGRGGCGAAVYCSGGQIGYATFFNNQTGDGGFGEYPWYDARGGDGAGVFCAAGELQITHCEIRNNIAGNGGVTNDNGSGGGSGGGIYSASGANLYICESYIANNKSGNGSDSIGAYRSTVGGNGGDGGGIYAASGYIVNCLIINNTAGNGGNGDKYDYPCQGGSGGAGGGVWGDDVVIRNCTIAANSTGMGGYGYDGFGGPGVNGQRGTGGGIFAGSNTDILNTIVWANVPDMIFGYDCAKVFYNNIQGSICPGNGNVNQDPLFADVSKKDYHLKSEQGRWEPSAKDWIYSDTVTSPCIDAGDPGSDWSRELYPHGKRINMGAYGGTSEASMSPNSVGLLADITRDDKVDILDLSALAAVWDSECVLCPQDLTFDNFVDIFDLRELSYAWLMGVK